MQICSIDGCPQRKVARGLCNKHYRRWQRHGDPLGGTNHYNTPEESFEARTEWHRDCLIWTGLQDKYGYGLISVGNGKNQYVHRYAWEQKYGPIEEGRVIDHKECYNPLCVNTNHLRVVTRAQNTYNRSKAKGKSGYRNVYPIKNGWMVAITKEGIRHYFGYYSNIEEAARVAEEKRKLLFGEFAGKG